MYDGRVHIKKPSDAMMDNSLQKWLINAFFWVALFILLICSSLLYRQFKDLLHSTQWVMHTYSVIQTNEFLLISILDANRLERDYLIKSDAALLQKEYSTLQRILPVLSSIKQLTTDNPRQQKLLHQLEPLVKKFTTDLQTEIPSNQKYIHSNSSQVMHNAHEGLINQIENIIEMLNINEETLLHKRTAGFSQFSYNTNLLIFIFSVVSYLIIILAFYMLYSREKKHRIQQINTNKMLEVQNKELIESNQVKSKFMEGMSHELLTPLNGIIGFVELIYHGKVGEVNKEQKEYLGDVLFSSRHLHELICNFLNLQLLQSKQMQFYPEKTNIKEVIIEVCNSINDYVENKSLSLDIQVNKDLEVIFIDPVRLKQIFYNLLSNAVKFSRQNGKITVRVLTDANENMKIEVEDDGIGMSTEDVNKLFLPFQKINLTEGKRHQGAGLGLVLTRMIVEALNGQIGAKSSIDQGSTFFVVLPRTLE